LAESYFGTADQAGNVLEWNDAVIVGSSRGLRGGSFLIVEGYLRASLRNNNVPSSEGGGVGFRVASSSIAAVPEPTSLLSMAGLLGGGLLLRRRSKNSL
jgi:hypothetical protein